MEEAFFANWIVKLITFLVPIGILAVAIISLRRKKGTNKDVTIENSKHIKIKQSDNSEAKVSGSENVDIQQ